ncbi:MAG: 50S ribosomal protein L29 [Candidatus Yonathbacteria bacterium]|nr:50S ribosomal protein L29 [Candidatus Yonathbacteria bacterium]
MHNKSEKELQKELREKREALRAFRFGISGSKIKNMREGRNLRKSVASILTEIKKRNTTSK